MPKAPLHVLYDPDCGICTKTARLLRRLDRRGRLSVIGFDEARRRHIADELDDARLYASFHTVGARGTASGADAIPTLLDELPFGRWPAAALRRSRFLHALSHRAYAFVARNRSPSCQMSSFTDPPRRH